MGDGDDFESIGTAVINCCTGHEDQQEGEDTRGRHGTCDVR